MGRLGDGPFAPGCAFGDRPPPRFDSAQYARRCEPGGVETREGSVKILDRGFSDRDMIAGNGTGSRPVRTALVVGAHKESVLFCYVYLSVHAA